MGSVGAVGAAFLLGNGYGSRAFADQLASTGTIADGFVVNGRHLSFGVDPQREMWVAGQLFNLNHYNAVPSGFKVSVEYGTDRSYGFRMPAELREPSFEVTRLGRRGYSASVTEKVDPRGRKYYWIGGLDHHVISVTPLQLDWTSAGGLEALADWQLPGYGRSR